MDLKVFKRRRRDLMQLMGEGIAIIPTAPEQIRNANQNFPFRPDSDFYYLTHFPEQRSIIVLLPEQEKFILFVRRRDQVQETWDGIRQGVQGVYDNYDVDEAYPIEKFDEMIIDLLKNQRKVFCNIGRYPEFDELLIESINILKTKKRAGVSAPLELVDIGPILHELRLIKRPEEIKAMRRAASISSLAHKSAMRMCKPGLMEYQIQAKLEYEFMYHGASGPAYSTIVASGGNACILHYTENNCKLENDKLVLIDAGAEFDGYAADITRTLPISGKYTAEQKNIYDIVLSAQRAAIDACLAGKQFNKPHDVSLRVICEGLKELGLLKGDIDNIIEKGDYKRFYMHRIGHWIGMDVHDVGDYKVENVWRLLEPSMVMTVEPGIYISPSDDVDERWHNIGIRIEDDVLITKDQPKLLSDVYRTTDEIEQYMLEHAQ